MDKILAGAIGSDIHTAGILNFLGLARKEGYECVYIGSVLGIDKLLDSIKEVSPDIIAISYRLGGESCRELLRELRTALEREGVEKKMIFGGTVETAGVARESGMFDRVFDGSESLEEVTGYLRGRDEAGGTVEYPQGLLERIAFKEPFPLIRHHIGLQTLEETELAVKELAQSRLLDIISLAPDQNCQQWFFHPENMVRSEDGAGGAPFRKREDFERMYEASRRGNYPLVRSYSGTRELLKFSLLFKETLNNAWAAIPLTWYSQLDGRSDRELLEAIRENQSAIAWNGGRGIPVEINEAHQWALRYCHDAIEVTMAYLAAMAAKRLGVKVYVAQYMMNTPPGISPSMDIAKSLAKKELIESLKSESFIPVTMVRPGLMSFPADPHMSMGQLVSSLFTASYLQPQIVHVVAYCEATKRATPVEIIESVKMVKHAMSEAAKGLPDFSKDDKIERHKEFLKNESATILEAMESIKISSLTSPETIYAAINAGILDAPGLRKMSVAKGKTTTATIDGATFAVDENNEVIDERTRLKKLGIFTLE
ncbi:MAG TPA: cobalamin B12-binding domain-containing protein [Mesotoga sp.]|jgi:methylmalonyl-CoA mutase cobalamin-binding subunit|nr:cobalamin-dependent protein [Mesotoga sp.]HPM95408.1 cobalamin B12-binding domain-containing protein [Mesotoga sp.]HQQ55473.1 cobalamin B12-binding domain-containing protein [Mesotoga sp.]